MSRISEKIKSIIAESILVSDGGIGTLLQEMGLPAGQMPEIMILEQPECISKVHSLYYKAGARIITTNTFGATKYKLDQYKLYQHLEKINVRAVEIAREAVGNDAFIAGSIGPTGVLLRPMGDVTINQLESVFQEQVDALNKAGVDFAIIETMGDIGELLAAARACFRRGLPFMASMTFDERLRSLSGSSPSVHVVVMEPFSPLAIGTNCGLGPWQMIEVVSKLSIETEFPVIAQPNAGLPELIDGETVFNQPPQDFAEASTSLADAGAAIIGGCCGTTPDHIAEITKALRNQKPVVRQKAPLLRFASRTRTYAFGSGLEFGIIGERINPTGRKKLAEQLKNGNFELAKKDAQKQYEAGVHLLDINVGVPDLDEQELMWRLVENLSGIVPDPAISIDSNSMDTLEAGIRTVAGRPLLNSINGDEKRMSRLLPLVRDTGVNFIALAMDEKGIPETCAKRIEIVKRIVKSAESFGIDRSRILVDCLVFTVGSQPAQPLETLKAVRYVNEELGCATVLGVSNVSFGLPDRKRISSTYLAMAISSGLSAGIINPLSSAMMQVVRSSELLLNRDPGAKKYLNYINTAAKKESLKSSKSQKFKKENLYIPKPETGQAHNDPIGKLILDGDKNVIVNQLEKEMASGRDPETILNESLIPAIQEVGSNYESGISYLPQLILAGETMKKAVSVIKPKLMQTHSEALHSTPMVLGTVEGDIHDIGKNIVAIVLENQGFEVIDLGKNVKISSFLKAIQDYHPKIVGLSALMTTTLPAM